MALFRAISRKEDCCQFNYHSRETKMKSAQPFWSKTMAIVWGDPFTEEGTCPHCGYYKDKNCTNDAYCVIKETKLMQDKKQARMLFNMHLGVKDMFRPESPGPLFYQSGQFMDTVQLLAPLNMEEGERIAWTYPNYEFAVLFRNGDLVIFHTENGHDLHFSRITGVPERAQLLHDIRTGEENMEIRWDKMDEIHIPETEGVWGAPL